MLRRILENARRELVRELRDQLDQLRVVLVRGGAPEDDQKALARHRADLIRELRPRLSDIDEPLLELEKRGDAFLERTVSLGGLAGLVNRAAGGSALLLLGAIGVGAAAVTLRGRIEAVG